MRQTLRKRSIRVVLAAMLAAVCLFAAMPMVVFASRGDIDGISWEYTLEDMFPLGQSGDYSSLEVCAGDEIRIPLTADMFTWSNGRTPLPMEAVKTQDLTRSRVKVGTKLQSGNITLDYVQLETDVFSGKPFFHPGTTTRTGRTAYISVMLAEEFVSVEDKDFSFDIFLTVDGKSRERLSITVSGTMKVDVETVDSDTGRVYTSDGLVVEATEHVKGLKMEIGHDVIITKTLFEGQKYYATCDIKSPYDPGFEEEFPEIYPALEFVYKLNTVNMNRGKSEVSLSNLEKVYFVYGDDMRYLGKSTEVLPFSEYYFMSLLELPALEMFKYEEDLARVPNWDQLQQQDLDNPETGGDESYEVNVNDNPSTGCKA